jgi:hypothetical protein
METLKPIWLIFSDWERNRNSTYEGTNSQALPISDFTTDNLQFTVYFGIYLHLDVDLGVFRLGYREL